jgi:hypothetical protein
MLVNDAVQPSGQRACRGRGVPVQTINLLSKDAGSEASNLYHMVRRVLERAMKDGGMAQKSERGDVHSRQPLEYQRTTCPSDLVLNSGRHPRSSLDLATRNLTGVETLGIRALLSYRFVYMAFDVVIEDLRIG